VSRRTEGRTFHPFRKPNDAAVMDEFAAPNRRIAEPAGMATKPAVASENPERSSRNVRDANGKGRTVSIVRTFLVSAKWNLRLNGGWIVAFNPTEGLEARRRFNSDREAIAKARRLAKFGASVRIDEETPL
jgi:hypothetical protein